MKKLLKTVGQVLGVVFSFGFIGVGMVVIYAAITQGEEGSSWTIRGLMIWSGATIAFIGADDLIISRMSGLREIVAKTLRL